MKATVVEQKARAEEFGKTEQGESKPHEASGAITQIPSNEPRLSRPYKTHPSDPFSFLALGDS